MDIPLALPVIDDDTRAEVDRVLQEEFYLGGDSVEAFEEEYAEYIGTEHAISVSSGTQAIHLSLRAAGVDEDSTVVTTPATFIASANAIERTGATIKFADINSDTYTIDVDEVREIVDKYDIDAILPVHLYGYPAEMDELQDVSGETPIISDACQAHGAMYRGEKVGSLGTAAGFSFYPSKNMTVGGDGGIVTTDSDEIAAEIQSLRDVGRKGTKKYEHQQVGYTARMDTMKAAIGRNQLEKLDEWNERRQDIARRYTKAWHQISELKLPPTKTEKIRPAWYLYVIRHENRDALAAFLEDRGIETGVHYDPPVHLQPPYRNRGYAEIQHVNTEKWADEVLSLPVHPHLSNEEVEHIIETVKNFHK